MKDIILASYELELNELKKTLLKAIGVLYWFRTEEELEQF